MDNRPVEVKEKHGDSGAGLLLAGMIVLFIGLGIQFNFMPAAVFFGVGLGLVAMAWWRSRSNAR
jgi:hypothetical protein